MKVYVKVYEEVKYSTIRPAIARTEYDNVEWWEVVAGEGAKAIEEETDGMLSDEYHEYLVLHLTNGETATYRNSHVDLLRA